MYPMSHEREQSIIWALTYRDDEPPEDPVEYDEDVAEDVDEDEDDNEDDLDSDAWWREENLPKPDPVDPDADAPADQS